MASTDEADRKRRHFSSISPTAASAKKHTFVPLSEEKKLEVAVLKYQNQKLIQRLDTQKADITCLADRLGLLKDRQKSYEKTLDVVGNSWEELLGDMESRSKDTKVLRKHRQDGDSPPEDAFLSRLLETGATESCSTTTISKPMEVDRQTDGEKAKNILRNLVATFDGLSGLKTWLYAASLEAIASCGELESTIADLEENNRKLAILKAGRDVAKEAFSQSFLEDISNQLVRKQGTNKEICMTWNPH